MSRDVTVFFDMDGVLADFVGGTFRVHGKSIPIKDVVWDYPKDLGFPLGSADPAFWAPLGNARFWENLEPLWDGMRLFQEVANEIGPARIGILSSGLCPGSCDGKRAWLAKHLPGYEKQAVFSHNKRLVGGPGKILIDDHDPNVDGFRAAGGRAVLIPRPWNSAAAESDELGNFGVESVFSRLEL